MMPSEEILFRRITNAVLDLQGADYQSLPRPYKALIQALDADELRPFTNQLTEQLDLDAFLAESNRSAGSMMGSARLAWPDDHDQCVGLSLLLLRKFRDEPDQLLSFVHHYFNGNTTTQSLRKFVSSLVIPFVRDFEEYVETRTKRVADTETRLAAVNSNISIQNFQGILGDVSGSTIHQNLNMSLAAKDLDGLLAHLRGNGIGDQELEELKAAIQEDPEPTSKSAFGGRVSAWIGKMLGLSASGAWTISLNAAGNLLSTAIAAYYGLGS